MFWKVGINQALDMLLGFIKALAITIVAVLAIVGIVRLYDEASGLANHPTEEAVCIRGAFITPLGTLDGMAASTEMWVCGERIKYRSHPIEGSRVVDKFEFTAVEDEEVH